ncbi:MAG TPA: acyltransferase family protein, partial [Chloroflexota bacterium]|nr:acyltransferase family protein [Chloroflexota bacterium]
MLGHVADIPLFNAAPNTLSWLSINLLDSASRWAVPVYVMLSGALLLDPARDESPTQFYRKRLGRLGIPIVFWSAFFMLFAIFYTHASTPREALRNLANGEPYLHLHFIFRLAGLYALTPALRVLVKHASRTLLIQTVLILFVIWSADSLINGLRYIEPSAFARFAPFMAYYLCGYLLRDLVPSRRTLLLALVGLVASILALVAWSSLMARYYDVSPFPSRPMLLHDFLSPVRITMGLCSWILLTWLFRRPLPTGSLLARISAWLAPLTLGIYLVHP